MREMAQMLPRVWAAREALVLAREFAGGAAHGIIGALIAYLASDEGSGAIWVANSDGTGQRAVGPATNPYVFDLDWSPDGQWIVGRNKATALIDVINVASNRGMPLRFTGFVGSPAWHPGSGPSGSAAVLRVAPSVRPAAPRARTAVRR